jgi:hypothetical protein
MGAVDAAGTALRSAISASSGLRPNRRNSSGVNTASIKVADTRPPKMVIASGCRISRFKAHPEKVLVVANAERTKCILTMQVEQRRFQLPIKAHDERAHEAT